MYTTRTHACTHTHIQFKMRIIGIQLYRNDKFKILIGLKMSLVVKVKKQELFG